MKGDALERHVAGVLRNWAQMVMPGAPSGPPEGKIAPPQALTSTQVIAVPGPRNALGICRLRRCRQCR